MSMFHESIHIVTVTCVKQGYTCLLGIDSQISYKSLITIFVRTDAVVWMFVQYYVDMIVFEVFYQFLRFGNQFTVPAIACPTPCAGMSGSDFGILCMPSHIEHHDIEGKVVFTIFPYQLAIIFVCVVPPAAIPRSVYIFAGHR